MKWQLFKSLLDCKQQLKAKVQLSDNFTCKILKCALVVIIIVQVGVDHFKFRCSLKSGCRLDIEIGWTHPCGSLERL